MTDATSPMATKAKLAASRAELLAAMGYGNADVLSTDRARLDAPGGDEGSQGAARSLPRSIVARWWRNHPLGSVVELGTPLLEGFARRQPGKLVACSAGTGALLVFLRPWKLLSLATIVTLIFKSSDISSLISGALRHERAKVQGEHR